MLDDRYHRLLRLFSPSTLMPVVAIISTIAILPYFAVRYLRIDYEFVTPLQTALYIMVGLFGLVTVLRAFLIYLEPSTKLEVGGLKVELSEYDIPNQSLKNMSKEIAELRTDIKSIGTLKIDTKDLDVAQFWQSLKTTLDKELVNGALRAIDEEFAKRDLLNKQWERFLTGFDEIRKRLYEETNNLVRRSNLNLALGSLTTVLAGVGLIVIVFWKPLDLTGVTRDEYGWKIISHYIPRLSLIIFAESFAYFFLRLYKAGLSDIKYYQTELSNVELKLVALKVAISTKDNDILKLVIEELSKTERNFILKKDETTIDLEKFKADSVNTKDWLEQITALIKSKS